MMAVRIRITRATLVALCCVVAQLLTLLVGSVPAAPAQAATRGGGSASASVLAHPRPHDIAPLTDTATAAFSVTATTSPTDTAAPTATAGATATATANANIAAAATPTLPTPTSTLAPTPTATMAPSQIDTTRAHLLAAPLAFVPNVGQSDARVDALARGPGYSLFLSGGDAVLALAAPITSTALTSSIPGLHAAIAQSMQTLAMTRTPETVLRLHLVGAAATPQMSTADALPGTANYLVGSDPNGWQTGVPTYGQVTYQGVYPGIDLLYDGSQGQLEQTWRVAPGANPAAISLAVQGADGLTLDAQDRLAIATASGVLALSAPVAYQTINGQRHSVSVSYMLNADGSAGFSVGSYDTSQPLIIDPVLGFSTLIGGGANDVGYGIAVDSQGNSYVIGTTASADFPTTTGAYTTTFGGVRDAFVTKINASGSALVYSTFLGGSASEEGYAIAVDSAGSAYVAGTTSSGSFPTTTNAYSRTYAGGADAFVTKLTPDGSGLVYSTYLGGSNADYIYGVALDPSGDAYVTGWTQSSDFPTTAGAADGTFGGGTCTLNGTNQPCPDAFVAKVDPTQSGANSLVYSTYLGGGGEDFGNAIAVNAAGNAYVTGLTASSGASPFPTTAGAYDSSPNGSNDAFETKVSTTGHSLVYSTYLGGSGSDYGTGIAVDAAGNVYVSGDTASNDFPTTPNAYDRTYAGGPNYGDVFVAELNPTNNGSALLYSTYVGAPQDEDAWTPALGPDGTLYVPGWTISPEFPTKNALLGQSNYGGGGEDGFLFALNHNLVGSSQLVWSTYLGGSGNDEAHQAALDAGGSVYVTGDTTSTNFLTTTGAYSTTPAGGKDAFALKIVQPSSGLMPWHAHHNVSLSDQLSLNVDAADGHVLLQSHDMSFAARGPGLVLNHTWSSTVAQAGATTGAGQGWASDLTLSMGGLFTQTVSFTDATGAVWPFLYVGALSATPPYTQYQVPAGQPWQLTTNPGGTPAYTLTNILTSESLTFDATGKYLADTDEYSNNNELTYGSGGPTSEANSGTRTLYFTNTNNLQTEAASFGWHQTNGPAGTSGQDVTYGFNGSNQLTTQTWGASTNDAITATYGYSGTQLVTVTTPSRHQWLLSYDPQGRLSQITSPVSGTAGQLGYTPAYSTTFTYSPVQTMIVEGAGTSGALTTTYTLDPSGEPITTTDGLNHSSGATYDADHDVLSSTSANGNTTTNYYQYVGSSGPSGLASTGLLTETVAPAIQPYSPLNDNMVQPTTLHTYDPTTHDLIETDLPEGGKTLYGYDGHHSVITTTELLTGTTIWRGSVNQLDQYGEVTGTVDGRGVNVNSSGVATLAANANLYTRHMAYRGLGDRISISTPPITTTLNGQFLVSTPVTTTYSYNFDGLQTSVTRPNGFTDTSVYNHLGRLVTSQQAQVTLWNNTTIMPTETTTYAPDGQTIQQVDGNGDVTQDSYDPLQRLVAETNPVSGTTVYTYNATEQTALQDPQQNVTTDQYDAAGRLITATAPISGVTQYQYDPVGNATVITRADTQLNPIQVDTRRFDALNRVLTDTVSGPNSTPLTTATRYDKDGNLYQTIYPAGNASVNTYDLADELVSTENDPAVVATATHQQQSTMSYDVAGNQVLSIDFGGNSTSTSFDPADRVVQTVSITNSSTVTTTNTLDPDANVLTSTNQVDMPSLPLQTSVDTATYNALDWTITTTDNGLTTSFGYDAIGQERTRTTAGGTITTTLDAEGRPLSITATGAGTASYGYNADDQPITASLPGGLSGSMTYDRNGQLTSWGMIGPSTGVTTSTVNLAYNYAYDGAQQVSAITATDNGVVQTQPVTHDAAGRMIGWGSPNGSNTWAFDGDGDVTSTTSFINGAIRTTVFTYSNTLPEELLQQHTDTLGVDNYTYDSNGNVISEVSTDPITSPYYVNQHYWYDPLERPVTVTNVQNGATVTATLGYNPQGQNITYTVVMSGQVIDNALYSYDSAGSLARTIATTATLNANGSIQSSGVYTDTYAYDPLGQPLYLVRQQNGTTKGYTYLQDGYGNVVGLVDGAGNRVDRYQYAPYGAPVGLGFWETVPQLFRNNGTFADPGLGLNNSNGTLTNVGSGTGTLADKSGGYLSYSAFNDDPFGSAQLSTSALPGDPRYNRWAEEASHQLIGFNWPLGRVSYLPSTRGCPSGVIARIVALGGQTDPRIDAGARNGITYQAGHLLAASFGGSDTDPKNFVAETSAANQGSMAVAENTVRRIVRAGYGVWYRVDVHYAEKGTIPRVGRGRLCICSSITVTIGRTPVKITGQTDFNTLYYPPSDDIYGEPEGEQGAVCGVAQYTFNNTPTSLPAKTLGPQMTALPPYLNNALVLSDCQSPSAASFTR